MASAVRKDEKTPKNALEQPSSCPGEDKMLSSPDNNQLEESKNEAVLKANRSDMNCAEGNEETGVVDKELDLFSKGDTEAAAFKSDIVQEITDPANGGSEFLVKDSRSMQEAVEPTNTVMGESSCEEIEEHGVKSEGEDASIGDNLKKKSEELESESTATSTAESHDLQAGSTGENETFDKQSQSLYHIKWIQWKGLNTPIITQNENGPCPLLAIINVLLLQRRVSIPPMQEIISSSQLMEYLGDCILAQAPERLPEGAQLNYEQNMHDAIGIMCKLQTGLDVNVKFTGVGDFEFTPECIVFDLLAVRLLHGWLVDPQNAEAVTAVGSSSYNQLVEKIIASKQEPTEDSQLISAGLIAEAFLEQTATQLTYHGLYELNSSLGDEELCVFFRNNHFNTLYKHKNELFLLATDQGYLTEDKVVWETLSNVEGDGCFVDANFRTVTQPQAVVQPIPAPPAAGADAGISQEDQDYLVALSLQEEQAKEEARQGQVPLEPLPTQPHSTPVVSNMTTQEWNDLQLAMRLQDEERRQQEQQLATQQRQQTPATRQAPSPSRRPPQPTTPRREAPTVQPRPQGAQQSQSSNDKCTLL